MYEAGLFVALLVAGYTFGRIAEVRHLRRLVERELATNALPAIASRHPPTDRPYEQRLVGGSAVISSDYFKSFVAGLVNLFGGRVTVYESLIDRARREAALRMKAEAAALGAAYVFNVKFETTRIAVGRVGAIEVLAYGTAMVPAASLAAAVPAAATPAVPRPAAAGPADAADGGERAGDAAPRGV